MDLAGSCNAIITRDFVLRGSCSTPSHDHDRSAYREGKISHSQLRRLLGFQRTEVDAFLIEGQLRELRQFVDKGISDLRSKFNRDTALAKAELQKHLSEVRMTPTKDGEDWHYVAEGIGIC